MNERRSNEHGSDHGASRRLARRAGVMVAALVALLTVTAPAGAVEVCFTPGTSTGAFQFNGAAREDMGQIEVTRAAMSQSGSVFYRTRLSATSDVSAYFSVDVQTTVTGANPGGDGVAIVLQDAPAGAAATGMSGGGIGYGGLSPSLAVEFDTVNNADLMDLDDNHVAITQDGVVSNHLDRAALPRGTHDLRNGRTNMWLTYTAATRTLAVYVSRTATRPMAPTLSRMVDLRMAFPSGFFYVGMTASTGLWFSRHAIREMVVTDRALTSIVDTDRDGVLDSCDTDDDNDCLPDGMDSAPLDPALPATPHCGPAQACQVVAAAPTAGTCVDLPCTRSAECPATSVVWNDLSRVTGTVPDGTSVTIPIPGWSPGVTYRAQGTGTVVYTPPLSMNGSFEAPFGARVGWAGAFPYMGNAGRRATVSYTFGGPATLRGPGWRFLVGVAGTGGAAGEGPTTITTSFDVNATYAGAFPGAFGGDASRVPARVDASTLRGSAGSPPDGYAFFLLPADATGVTWTYDDRMSPVPDGHGYVVGMIDLQQVLTCRPGAPRICVENFCGDGVARGMESCDDGNATPGDGCSATCTVEPGFVCTGARSACVRPPPTDICYQPGGDVSGVQINGSARVEGGQLVVTPEAMSQSGSVFFRRRLSVAGDLSAFFAVETRTSVTPSNPGGDGVAIVLQDAPAGAAATGMSGGGIGYGGLSPSLAVEFDTVNNADLMDLDDNHVAVTQDGVVSNHLDRVSLSRRDHDLRNGPTNMWLTYTAATGVLEVYISRTATRPMAPTLRRMVDLRARFASGYFYVGLTGSTGLWSTRHAVTRLVMTDRPLSAITDTDRDGVLDSCDTDDDNDCLPDGMDSAPLDPAQPATPHCAPMQVCTVLASNPAVGTCAADGDAGAPMDAAADVAAPPDAGADVAAPPDAGADATPPMDVAVADGSPTADGGGPDAGTPTPRCGDGIRGAAEGCDDGNTASGDGCSATCAVEEGFLCSGAPSLCVRPPPTDICFRPGGDLTGVRVNGDARVEMGRIVVTPDRRSTRGSVFFERQLTVASDLSAFFSVDVLTSSGPGADGVAIVLQDTPAGASATGQEGMGIGYGGLSPSLAVEFDTVRNAELSELDDNHVALVRDGDVRSPLERVALSRNDHDLRRGRSNLWLTYTASTTTLEVYLARGFVRPATPTLRRVINLREVFPSGRFYVGLTGSTGNWSSRHAVDALFMSDRPRSAITDTDRDGVPDSCDTDDDNDCLPDGMDSAPLDPALPATPHCAGAATCRVTADNPIAGTCGSGPGATPTASADSGCAVRPSGQGSSRRAWPFALALGLAWTLAARRRHRRRCPTRST